MKVTKKKKTVGKTKYNEKIEENKVQYKQEQCGRQNKEKIREQRIKKMERKICKQANVHKLNNASVTKINDE